MKKSDEILVIGNGIAALSSALLFSRKKYNVSILIFERNISPIITVNYPTFSILKALWGICLDDINCHGVLDQHVVAWGKKKPTRIKTEPRIVISEVNFKKILLENLQKQYPEQLDLEYFSSEQLLDQRIQQMLKDPYRFNWVINANKSQTIATIISTHSVPTQIFGQRYVIYGEATLSKNHDQPNTSWMESTKDGWCFFAPISHNRALVQAMVASDEQDIKAILNNILKQTSFINKFIDYSFQRVHVFNASPRNSLRYCGDRWIAIGGAAFSFDPICGDGVGYALRSSILAYAVINAINRGFPKNKCLEHYQMRLSETFSTHIVQCVSYYNNVFENHAWDSDLGIMNNYIETYLSQHIETKPFRYSLRNLELHDELKE